MILYSRKSKQNVFDKTEWLGGLFHHENSNALDIQKKTLDIQNKLNRLLDTVTPSMALMIAEQHKKIFSQYKNIYAGKSAALVATGPTLNDYIPIPDAVHIGVNGAFRQDIVKLDYWFATDLQPIENNIEYLLNLEIPKFYGQNTASPVISPLSYTMVSNRSVIKAIPKFIPEQDRYGNVFYFNYWGEIPRDIEYEPLTSFSTSATAAFEFALHLGVKKIYLVGCDSAMNGYFEDRKQNGDFNVEALINGWKRVKNYVQIFYPDVEIISVNPVGLKGMFGDIYTNSKEDGYTKFENMT